MINGLLLESRDLSLLQYQKHSVTDFVICRNARESASLDHETLHDVYLKEKEKEKKEKTPSPCIT
jgi:hypothetical protein